MGEGSASAAAASSSMRSSSSESKSTASISSLAAISLSLFFLSSLPCIMWLCVYKPTRFGWSWFANWICIILGVMLMISSPIGGLRSIIVSAKSYKFFS